MLLGSVRTNSSIELLLVILTGRKETRCKNRNNGNNDQKGEGDHFIKLAFLIGVSLQGM
jgi:hypothetical protein